MTQVICTLRVFTPGRAAKHCPANIFPEAGPAPVLSKMPELSIGAVEVVTWFDTSVTCARGAPVLPTVPVAVATTGQIQVHTVWT